MQGERSIASRISRLRETLSLNQAELGTKLGCSAMAVSRWERGARCPAGVLIGLGKLSKPSECWSFWKGAGLTTEDVIRVLPMGMRKREPAEGHGALTG